ncbi:RHS repeat domain-containing protein, partial [Candidatus Entotheonella palauensis]|uniref:RHS repeat domain-containing protein n=1 Tax=Candidatus Entotheonella palauensis TaxID=93172 RepID=UPI00277B5CF5
TDEQGQVVWQADYLPFGEIQAEVAAKPNTKRFVGKEHDPETGLFDFGARYLAPELGRFTTPDPVQAFSSPYWFSCPVGSGATVRPHPQRCNRSASKPFTGLTRKSECAPL